MTPVIAKQINDVPPLKSKVRMRSEREVLPTSSNGDTSEHAQLRRVQGIDRASPHSKFAQPIKLLANVTRDRNNNTDGLQNFISTQVQI